MHQAFPGGNRNHHWVLRENLHLKRAIHIPLQSADQYRYGVWGRIAKRLENVRRPLDSVLFVRVLTIERPLAQQL